MRRLLDLFRSRRPAKPATSPRPLSARPTLESLEDRWTPSTASPSLHAVQPTSGQAAVFFLNTKNNALNEKTPQGQIVQIGGANSITDFSAGLDRAGKPDVFARLNGKLSVWDGVSFTSLNQPMEMKHFAAVQGGRAYFEGVDHSFWEYTIPYQQTVSFVFKGHVVKNTITLGGWQELASANTVYSMDAVTQTATGTDMVFTIGHDLSLRQFDASTNAFTTIAGAGSYRTDRISVGLDDHGYAMAWTEFFSPPMLGNNIMSAWDSAPGAAHGWHSSQLPDEIVTVSAFNNGFARVLYEDGSFGVFAPSNTGGLISLPDGMRKTDAAAISCTGNGDTFVMTTEGHLLEQHTLTSNIWQKWV